MQVHLIKAKTVRLFAKDHAPSIQSFEEWIEKVKSTDWDTPQDMKRTFGSVDLLGKGTSRAVFDIGGNNYRIICKYQFGITMVHLLPGLERMRNTQSFVTKASNIPSNNIN